VALEGKVAHSDLPPRPELGDDLGHIGVDVLVSQRPGDRHPVMAVLDEVQLPDAVDVNGRHRLALALRGVDALPAGSHPTRGRVEAAIELAPPVDGSDDRVELGGLLTQVALAAPAERLNHLVEGQNGREVAVAAHARCDLSQRALAPGAPEVELGVGLWEARVTRGHDLKVAR
jgi:hypothetical protein